jgi:hypothetical protein
MIDLRSVLAELQKERDDLQKERDDLQSQLQGIDAVLSILGKASAGPPGGKRRRRNVSRTGVASIRAAQKLRWARWRKAQKL